MSPVSSQICGCPSTISIHISLCIDDFKRATRCVYDVLNSSVLDKDAENLAFSDIFGAAAVICCGRDGSLLLKPSIIREVLKKTKWKFVMAFPTLFGKCH